MLKITDFVTAPDIDYVYLQNQVDSYPANVPYLLDLILPSSCQPEEATIGFYHTDSEYVAFLDPPIQYSGENVALANLAHSGEYATNEWDEMVSFCRSFPGGRAPAPPPPPPKMNASDSQPVGNHSEDILTDSSVIDLPPASRASPLTFDFLRGELRKRVIGQEFAVDCSAFLLSAHLSKPNPKRPLSILFHGAPATGKSELAKTIGDVLARHDDHHYKVVWTDLNTYTEAHTIHNLTGAPASYIGHDETPVFYTVVDNPYTVFIWDEVEKSHPAVLKLFMGIMDEGRCASNKELPDHSREYDFTHSIHIFTTNSPIGELSESKKSPIGFVNRPSIKNISYEDDAVSIEYEDIVTAPDTSSLVQRIYDQNEQARRALVKTGVLPEIATRFSGFAEFKPLSDQSKIRIIAKTILDTGYEYDIRLSYIAPSIIQGIAEAAGKNGFSMRSYRTIAEGYLGSVFSGTEAVSRPDRAIYRLEGSLATPQLIPA